MNELDLLNFEVIGIDEAQFFEHLKSSVLELVKQKKIVIIAGLDNYNQNIFHEIMSLIPYATEVKKLTSLCDCCIDEKNDTINFAQ